jgi:hypothetical protein
MKIARIELLLALAALTMAAFVQYILVRAFA